jgi:hypothetical protein
MAQNKHSRKIRKMERDVEELRKELTIVIPTLNEEEAIGKY